MAILLPEHIAKASSVKSGNNDKVKREYFRVDFASCMLRKAKSAAQCSMEYILCPLTVQVILHRPSREGFCGRSAEGGHKQDANDGRVMSRTIDRTLAR